MLNKQLKIIFFTFLTILLSHHVLLFLTVNINMIDDDQVIMWLGAKHYSAGLFFEPRFYGQSYNTFMEALVAMPFIWLQVPIYYAVPFATHLIFLTPFLFTVFYLYKKQQLEKAILVLVILLCMPLGFDVMTSIPRGFVTGVFFTLFFVVNLFNPKNYKYIYINTLFSFIGVLVNPNSILVSAPFLFYLFLNNYNDKTYYKYSVFALLSGIPFELLLNQFYRSHPENIIYTFDNNFDFKYFKTAIQNLHSHFSHVGLFIEGTATITLITFLLIGLYFFRSNKKWFIASLLFLSIILVSFFSQKVSHGGDWPFFSLSRMFIAIPFFYMCCIILLKTSISKIKYILIAIVLTFTVYKEITFNDKLAFYGKEENFLDVNVFSLNNVFQYSQSYKQICKSYDTDAIIIIGWTWHENLIHYAGQVLDDNYPKTFKPHFERRRWRIEEEKKNVYDSFIIYTRYNNLDSVCNQKYKDVHIQRVNELGTFYVYNNKRTTVDFLKHIKAETLGF